MLDARTAFKVGFLLKCAEDGLGPDGAEALAKAALFDGAWDTAKTLGSAGLAGALLAPPVVGAAGGVLLSRATDVDDTDVDDVRRDVRRDELVQELLRQSEHLNGLAAARAQREGRLPARRHGF